MDHQVQLGLQGQVVRRDSEVAMDMLASRELLVQRVPQVTQVQLVVQDQLAR
jgi:hypothetical protein